MNQRHQPESRIVTPDLLRALRHGDQRAFERVYLHYVSSVRRFLTMLTRSEELGAEITQEVFVILWEKRAQIDPDKNISAYIYKIAKNQTFKHFRRNRTVVTGEAAPESVVVEPYTLPDELLMQCEKERLVEKIVSSMPPRRRQIYRMSREEGASNDEIATRLGISKSTVENQITAALNDIRNSLKKEF
ncbi:MAG: RNA polymerase sigma-70 factor [Alistipes sp.]|nr:RNA polymerase sigma-70 factor [Alistipes sp.]